MKKRSLMIASLVMGFLLFLNIAIATETLIKIKTVPFSKVQATPHDANSATFVAYEKFIGYSDSYGDVEFIFKSEVDAFDLVVYIKDMETHESITSKKFSSGFKTGETIKVEVAPEGYNLVYKNETNEANEDNGIQNGTDNLILDQGVNVSNKTNISNTEESSKTDEEVKTETEEAEDNTPITGLAIFDEDSTIMKWKYYLLGGIFILGFLAFFVFHKQKQHRKVDENKENNEQQEKKIITKKLSELKEEQKQANTDNAEIRALEEKIQEAQVEINRIKNKEKIKQAEERIRKEQEELERMKQESNEQQSF